MQREEILARVGGWGWAEAKVVLIHIEEIRRNRNRTDPYWGGGWLLSTVMGREKPGRGCCWRRVNSDLGWRLPWCVWDLSLIKKA